MPGCGQLSGHGDVTTEVTMSAQSAERTAHWPQRTTSHWTRDGRFHTGSLETCLDCPTRPDEREPRPSDAG